MACQEYCKWFWGKYEKELRIKNHILMSEKKQIGKRFGKFSFECRNIWASTNDQKQIIREDFLCIFIPIFSSSISRGPAELQHLWLVIMLNNRWTLHNSATSVSAKMLTLQRSRAARPTFKRQKWIKTFLQTIRVLKDLTPIGMQLETIEFDLLGGRCC